MIADWRDCHVDLWKAARSLDAFLGRDGSDEADVGGLLVAEGLAALRALCIGQGIWQD